MWSQNANIFNFVQVILYTNVFVIGMKDLDWYGVKIFNVKQFHFYSVTFWSKTSLGMIIDSYFIWNMSFL